MLKAISTYVYLKQRLHPGMLDSLRNAGAEGIELFAARGHFDYSDRQHVNEIAAWFKSSSVEPWSMHSPMHSDYEFGRAGEPPVNLIDNEKRRRVESMDEIKRALEAAEQIPFRYLIQHIGISGEEFDARKFEFGMSSIEHLHAFAKPLGVKLLLENIPNEMSTPERLREFLNVLHYDDLGVCFDFGHAHIMSTVAQAFDILRTHVRSTHVHDNDKQSDAHLWPGDGNIDWTEALALLRTAPHTPALLLEAKGEGQTRIVEHFQEAWTMLGKAGTAAEAGKPD
jgi:sugar phosphate isomerase/epimerase